MTFQVRSVVAIDLSSDSEPEPPSEVNPNDDANPNDDDNPNDDELQLSRRLRLNPFFQDEEPYLQILKRIRMEIFPNNEINSNSGNKFPISHQSKVSKSSLSILMFINRLITIIFCTI